MNRPAIHAAIDTERERQDSLHGPRSIASPDVTDLFRLAVLIEEVGEVGTALQTGDRDNLRAELTEVAACCVGWLEALP
jgi:NTP pyrophosphatase (non-canonical NTP hydrolase)